MGLSRGGTEVVRREKEQSKAIKKGPPGSYHMAQCDLDRNCFFAFSVSDITFACDIG